MTERRVPRRSFIGLIVLDAILGTIISLLAFTHYGLDAAAATVSHPIQIPKCTGKSSAPILDHVVLLVEDLDRASTSFRNHGFRLKNGRLHANNLLNRHIKFRDGSSLELMTLRGDPGDALAQRYADVLAMGEGGVYIALNVSDIEMPQSAAADLGLETHRSSSGPWQFLGFPASSSAAAVFFSAGGSAVLDPDSLLSHRLRVTGLAEAWLEGGPELTALLERLGATRCGAARSHDGLVGERLGLNRGTVVIVPRRAGMRPRVLGVVLRSDSNHDNLVYPHAQFWLRYQRR